MTEYYPQAYASDPSEPLLHNAVASVGPSFVPERVTARRERRAELRAKAEIATGEIILVDAASLES